MCEIYESIERWEEKKGEEKEREKKRKEEGLRLATDSYNKQNQHTSTSKQNICISGCVFMTKLVYWYMPVSTTLIVGGHHTPLINRLVSEKRESNQGRLETGGREITEKPEDSGVREDEVIFLEEARSGQL